MLSPANNDELPPAIEMTSFERMMAFINYGIVPTWPFILLWIIWFLTLTWGLFGIAAVIVSILCVVRRYNKNTWVGMGGLVTAFLLGPLYFIYWAFIPGYCLKE